MITRFLTALLVTLAAQQSIAQSPTLSYLLPLALAPGKTTTVTFFGDNLAGISTLWTSLPASDIGSSLIDEGGDPGKVKFRIVVGDKVPNGIGAIRLASTNGITGLQLFMIDGLPTIAESGQNSSIQTAQEIKSPVAIDGNCDEQSFDYYQFAARKGERLTVEVVAQRLGSMLDPVLRLLDSRGRELEFCEDTPGIGADARFTHQFSNAGKYFIELRDTRYGGGKKYQYHLRVGDVPLAGPPFLPLSAAILGLSETNGVTEFQEVEPNDTLTNASKINIPIFIHGRFIKPKDRDFYEFNVDKDQRLAFAGRTRSFGSPCDLFLRLYKGDGTQLAEANVTGADEGNMTNTFTAAGTYYLMVEELNLSGGPEFEYKVEITPYHAGFALNVETNRVEATPGGEIKVNCVRRDYEGPISLALTDSANRFEIANNIIPAKTNQIQLRITLPAELKPGEILNLGILGEARIGETNFQARASTLPALRKEFPSMLYPPRELDGLIALGVKVPSKRDKDSQDKASTGE